MILGLNCVPLCFQVVSGLDINLNKSKMVSFGGRNNDDSLASLLGVR